MRTRPVRSSPAPRAGADGSVPERPKGADCKSAGIAYGGSNPSRPTMGRGAARWRPAAGAPERRRRSDRDGPRSRGPPCLRSRPMPGAPTPATVTTAPLAVGVPVACCCSRRARTSRWPGVPPTSRWRSSPPSSSCWSACCTRWRATSALPPWRWPSRCRTSSSRCGRPWSGPRSGGRWRWSWSPRRVTAWCCSPRWRPGWPSEGSPRSACTCSSPAAPGARPGGSWASTVRPRSRRAPSPSPARRSPWRRRTSRRPFRHLGRWLIGAAVVGSMLLGALAIGGAIATAAVGLLAAAIVHLVVGSPGGRPTNSRIERALRELGVDARELQAVPDAPLGRRPVHRRRRRRAAGGQGLRPRCVGCPAARHDVAAGVVPRPRSGRRG